MRTERSLFSSSKSEECGRYVGSKECDLCGKVTYIPIHHNGYSFCPDCWNEVQGYVNDPTKLLEEINKIHSDVIKIRCSDPIYDSGVTITNKNVADLVKAAKDIARELHELNKNLKRR